MTPLRHLKRLISQRRGFLSSTRMASQLRQRAVVSSFICTSPQSPTGLTFALFKRSQDVRTYRGKWAVCSGSIDATDPSPEFAARREIREETTLTESDITLLRRGKPFSLTDKGLKTEWTVHPFAFQLKENAKPITFDWEHTEYHFVKPSELHTYEHVPQLEIGMNRVLVSPETEKGLAVLRDDHESGAQALAVKALEILLQAVRGEELSRLSSSEEFWEQLRWIAWHLSKNGRPSMAAAIESGILKALSDVKKQLESPESEGIGGIPLSNLKDIFEEAIQKRIEMRHHTLDTLANHFVKFIGETPPRKIVTLSFSRTVTKCLAALITAHIEKGEIHLSVLESRPKFEGAAFVNTLLNNLPNVSKNLKIEIVSDASVGSVVKDADFIVLGGDKVLSTGDVSNKIGSNTAAIVARALNPKCRVITVFETTKISAVDTDHVELNDEKEVTDVWPVDVLRGLEEHRKKGYEVDVRNEYFEWVEAKYIDQHISEEGLLSVEDIARLSQGGELLEASIFGDL